MHGQCPVGPDSWCKFQRAALDGKMHIDTALSDVSKYSSANSDDSSESKLLKELKLLRQEVKELRRSRSFSRNRFNSCNRGKSFKPTASHLNWYHNKFATKARILIQPCPFQEILNWQE
ncbi:hypothetical protein TNCV_1884351 [Trichonephila clavipes]|nr:hypothetical protein TNCV_1884351 [Trichonephila clavipes]